MVDIAGAGLFRVVADGVSQERQVGVGMGGDEELPDAAGVAVDELQRGGLRAGRRDRSVRFDEEVSGFAGPVEVDHGYAEDPFQDAAMDDAGVFVAGEDEAERGEAQAVPLAVEREPHPVHGVDIEEGRGPGGRLFRHLGEFRLG